MKKRLGIVTVLVLLLACQRRPMEVHFMEGRLEAALQKAAENNKLVYVDAYTTWCGHCKRMDRKVYTDQQVGAALNEKFVNVRINMEKGEGPEVAARYGIHVYPTMMILSADGKVLRYHEGYLSASELVDFIHF